MSLHRFLFSRSSRNDSISKTVLIGYLINLLLLVMVSGASIYGVSRLKEWIQNTEQVDQLLHKIYLARIQTKSFTLSSDTLSAYQVDSLNLEISKELNEIKTRRLNANSLNELTNVDNWLREFNRYWGLFLELKQRKKLAEERMEVLFERIFVAARQPLPRLQMQQSGESTDAYNDLLFQFAEGK